MTTSHIRYRDRAYAIEAIDGDHITACMERAGTFYELDLLEAIRDYKRPGTYVDVGAHIGNHSVFFAVETCANRVVAFEPNPIALACLVDNAERYGIEAYPSAVHDAWTHCRVVDPYPDHGRAHIEQGNDTRCKRLDDLGLRDVAVLKIDVEGAEIPVLRSAVSILERDHPVVSAEAHTPAAASALDAFLAPFGYQRRGVYGFTPTHLWDRG